MWIALFVTLLATGIVLAMLSLTPAMQRRFRWLTAFRTYLVIGITLGAVMCYAGYWIAKNLASSFLTP